MITEYEARKKTTLSDAYQQLYESKKIELAATNRKFEECEESRLFWKDESIRHEKEKLWLEQKWKINKWFAGTGKVVIGAGIVYGAIKLL